VKRLLRVAALFQLVHLADEALSGMHDDPIIAAAYDLVAPLGPRHAAYLVFQITFALAVIAALSPPRLVHFVSGLALVAEGHHTIRAICMHHANSGLFTSLPLPILGALLCFTTSSSPWASAASSSVSRLSWPPRLRRAFSVFRNRTTTPPRA
jgi:hypothetical protein